MEKKINEVDQSIIVIIMNLDLQIHFECNDGLMFLVQ